ncbi:MAG TPA: hypothetical protein VEY70_01730 [Metabacillus sp.]|nr:hypothetical protein [Metabacillus sp.]
MGGIEIALISMLESMSENKYDITLLVMGKGRELADKVPHHVRVKNISGKLWNYIKNGRVKDAFKTGLFTILAKRSKTIFEQELYHSKMLPISSTEYDIAVAYHTPASFPVVYVMNNIKSFNESRMDP